MTKKCAMCTDEVGERNYTACGGYYFHNRCNTRFNKLRHIFNKIDLIEPEGE